MNFSKVGISFPLMAGLESIQDLNFMMNELFIPFSVLVDEVTKNENRLRDFLYDVFRLQGKTGKTKMKNNNKKKTIT